MGSFQTKEKSNKPREKDDVEALRAKVKVQIREEVKEIVSMREREREAYEQELMVLALKEAEWNKERKRLREEVKVFKNKLEYLEKLRIIRENHHDDNEVLVEKIMWGNNNMYDLMEYMREERARRDDAVDKWKRLYLAIKTELDHLIKMTHQATYVGEGGVSWILEEEEYSLLKSHEWHYKEVKAKEETIQDLRAQLASMEKERSGREREVDILRQSLKIMSHKSIKKGGSKHNAKSFVHQEN